MPMLTMSVIGLPVKPRSSPACSASASARIFARSASTSGMTFSPYAVSGASAGRRNATCSAGRSSVLLIGMAAEHELDPARHLGLLGEVEQRLERAGVEQLPAEVEQQPFGARTRTARSARASAANSSAIVRARSVCACCVSARQASVRGP